MKRRRRISERRKRMKRRRRMSERRGKMKRRREQMKGWPTKEGLMLLSQATKTSTQ